MNPPVLHLRPKPIVIDVEDDSEVEVINSDDEDVEVVSPTKRPSGDALLRRPLLPRKRPRVSGTQETKQSTFTLLSESDDSGSETENELDLAARRRAMQAASGAGAPSAAPSLAAPSAAPSRLQRPYTLPSAAVGVAPPPQTAAAAVGVVVDPFEALTREMANKQLAQQLPPAEATRIVQTMKQLMQQEVLRMSPSDNRVRLAKPLVYIALVNQLNSNLLGPGLVLRLCDILRPLSTVQVSQYGTSNNAIRQLQQFI